MRPFILAAALAALAASPAGAVSLSMATDQSVYSLGETITVTLTGDTTDGPEALFVLVDVGYDDPSLVDGLAASATQSESITSLDGQLTWAITNPACQVNTCPVFDQVGFLSPFAPDPAIIIGTLTIPTLAAGVLTLSTGVNNPVEWFGAAAPAPVTVTIVPEPTTASLVGLGLLGLGAWRRQRRSAGGS